MTKTTNSKRIYFAVTVEEDGKLYSYVLPVSTSDNVLCKLTIKGLKWANVCETKKRAAEIVTFWNDCARANGNYMFSETF